MVGGRSSIPESKVHKFPGTEGSFTSLEEV